LDLRRVECLTKDGFKPVRMKDLKVGDVFRIFEPDGTIIPDEKGNTMFKVQEPPAKIKGTWGVNVMPRGR